MALVHGLQRRSSWMQRPPLRPPHPPLPPPMVLWCQLPDLGALAASMLAHAHTEKGVVGPVT